MARRLIVNADDFGFTRDVNAGIVEACERGILRCTTLMANGAAFDHAVELARRTPQLDIGCHPGRSSADDRSPTGSTGCRVRSANCSGAPRRGLDAAAEIEEKLWPPTEIEKIQAAGLQPTHLDAVFGTSSTHLVPRVLEAVLRVAHSLRRSPGFTKALRTRR